MSALSRLPTRLALALLFATTIQSFPSTVQGARNPSNYPTALAQAANKVKNPDALPASVVKELSRVHRKSLRRILVDLGQALARKLGRTVPPTRMPPFAALRFAGASSRGHELYDNPRDGAHLVRVPASRHLVGSPGIPETRPVREVQTESFLIDLFEVTVKRYSRFLEATGGDPPPTWEIQQGRPNYPVQFVSWDSATAYACWAGGRLPTTQEWITAALGFDRRALPWGSHRIPLRELVPTPSELRGLLVARKQLRKGGLSPADTSPFGLADTAWNLREWVLEPAGRHRRYTLGGDFSQDHRKLRHLQKRRRHRRDRGAREIGFRMVVPMFPVCQRGVDGRRPPTER